VSHRSENRTARIRRRRATESRRFDNRTAACLFCGPLPYAALVDPEKTKRFVEEHHVFGQHHDPNVVVTLCLICHRALGDGMLDEGWTAKPSPNPVITADVIFRALAAFFRLLADAFVRYAERMSAAIERLDATMPAWRRAAEGSTYA
jgi:hypothetical protein